MNRSETIGALSLALSKAQGMITGALKDSANPFFKSKYADLESVWDACREPLAKNELAVIQLSDETDKGIIVDTILSHSSGEWVSGRMFIPVAKIDAQTVGSACTYARRYSLQMIVGIAPIDDDGNAATGKDDKKPAPPTIATITKAQANDLLALLTDNGVSPQAFKEQYALKTSMDLPVAKIEEAKKWITDNKKEQA
jgi:hypothetical protein